MAIVNASGSHWTVEVRADDRETYRQALRDRPEDVADFAAPVWPVMPAA
ncbi:phage tail assembly chaperone [Pseudooceanicola nanhaiensis]|nr:phage tail assembly chaperone [Pseudooceanicola nanhaiensis]MCA0922992.1 phage tail assembly chaperone [Pseudooceanicola nanhaiensis]